MSMKRHHYKSAGPTTNKVLFNVQFLQSSMQYDKQTTDPKQKNCRIREKTVPILWILSCQSGKKSNFIIHLKVL